MGDGDWLDRSVDDVTRLEQVSTEVVVEGDARSRLSDTDLGFSWESTRARDRNVEPPERSNRIVEVDRHCSSLAQPPTSMEPFTTARRHDGATVLLVGPRDLSRARDSA
jgi:hypothetical protein